MFFTQEDYRKIEKWLLSNGIKDTEFVEASTPLQGNETLAFVQKGKNVKVSLKDLIDQIFLLGVSDFLNISDKYKENYISLNQAIALIPNKSRKIGQVITFLNQEGVWKIYQFQGTGVNQWNNTTLWLDLIQRIQGLDIIDSEDIIPKISAINQTSLLLADKSYNPDDFSGLGRVYLRKNMQKVINPNTGMSYTTNLLTQSMVSKENTIYIIQYDYSLNYQTLNIQNNSVLVFNGGSIDNGTLNCNSTIIVGKFIGNSSLTGTYTYQDAQADEEDITQNQSYVLKFKDKEYDEANFSGLGRTYLRKNIVNGVNILSQDMINNSNTIYHIQYDYNLNGGTLTIPEGCILDFQGGSFTNGAILFKNTALEGHPLLEVNVLQGSSLRNEKINIDWFGAKPNNSTFDNSIVFERILNFYQEEKGGTILVPKGTYYSKSFKIPHYYNLEGTDRDSSVLEAMDNGKTYSYAQNGENYTIENIFIAVQSPKTNISNLTINGGRTEGYKVTGVGQYQAAFNTNFYNIEIRNCYYGCLINATIGGVSKYEYCRFDGVGVEFCLKFMWEQASLNIEHCFIEDGKPFQDKIEENANSSIILFENCTMAEGINVSNNYFEANYCKYIYNFENCYLHGISISNNVYLLADGWGYCEFVYRLGNDVALPFTIINEIYQGLNGLRYYFLIKNTVRNTAFVCFNIPKEINSVIYFDDTYPDGSSDVAIDTTRAHVIFYSKNGIETDILPKTPIILPNNITFSSITAYIDGIFRVLETAATTRFKLKSDTELILDSPLLTITGNNMYFAKNSIFSEGYFKVKRLLSEDSITVFNLNNKYGNFPVLVNDGYIHIKQNKPYMCVSNGTYESSREERWVDLSSIPSLASGVFADRPMGENVGVGTYYFCTDKQTEEGATNGIAIYYKGNDVWVDALGRVVV